MKSLKPVFLALTAGGFGGLTSGILVWVLGKLGVTPTLGFNMVPEFAAAWIAGRVFASCLWGLIFLFPIHQTAPVTKGALLGILPWLSSILVVFPYKMQVGFFGLEMGYGTPVWTLFFGAFWGVSGMLFLVRMTPPSKS
ncbi:MAG: hypothetical protein GY945_12085 [Rhodobacteraceae bacterium]|nr:hypothetical protein [Paracoccaceae bacterium]